MLTTSLKKYPKGDRMFIGCNEGSIVEYSINKNKIVRYFVKFASDDISSIQTTIDKKTLFVCDRRGGFRELNIRTNKVTNFFGIENARCCLVTPDNKYLITAEDGKNKNLSKYSIETKQLVKKWKTNLNQLVGS